MYAAHAIQDAEFESPSAYGDELSLSGIGIGSSLGAHGPLSEPHLDSPTSRTNLSSTTSPTGQPGLLTRFPASPRPASNQRTSGGASDGVAGFGLKSNDEPEQSQTRAAEASAALDEELYAVYPPYVDLDRIEAAVRGEEEGLRAQLDIIREDKENAKQEWMDLRERGTLWLVVAYLA